MPCNIKQQLNANSFVPVNSKRNKNCVDILTCPITVLRIKVFRDDWKH